MLYGTEGERRNDPLGDGPDIDGVGKYEYGLSVTGV